LNIYQQNPWCILDPEGDDIDDRSDMGPNDVIVEINVTTVPGWDHDDCHQQIDDDRLVQTRIKNDLDTHLNP
ncbi:MAG: hypothetical protein ACREQV_27010, partial [Candidatus Binatia bacterium]